MLVLFLGICIVASAATGAATYWLHPWFALLFVIIGPVFLIGLSDAMQSRHAVRRNFPLIGQLRYFFEFIRPELQQYFVETNFSGRPVSREYRSVVYQRSKKALDSVPFGTQHDVYEEGHSWVEHSMSPVHVRPENLRVPVGGPDTPRPYSLSLMNISAMSFGALSKNAILALNSGAQLGGFAHNTGEGGISPYHLKPGGDLIWQIGTGYFGCRTPDGGFCESTFKEKSRINNVKMIEIKISQGAKPGHGGLLPGEKVSHEIAACRGVEVGKTVNSPPAHREFSTPTGLLEFVAKLRELSGGKPVGFKICLGRPHEFVAICLAMQSTGIKPDYIAIDGAEGGTGAAPLEFTNSVGVPLDESLSFVHDTLTGFDLRKDIRLIASGKVFTAMHMVSKIALGADAIYSARGMMLSLGCIQALRCNSNECPVGVATNDPQLVRGLVVGHKSQRVANYHKATLEALAEMTGAMGKRHPSEITRQEVFRRISDGKIQRYDQIFCPIPSGILLGSDIPERFARYMDMATADSFHARAS
jgi:glutamate synthase domain-containing protein 2